MAETAPLRSTVLRAAHEALGARLVPFAGYAMPVQYPGGIIAEHLWTRAHAGLFDVSHMGQAVLVGPDYATTARALEALVPADLLGLARGRQRYTQLLAEDGGILDDLMVMRPADPAREGELYLVVNAGTKEADHAHLVARLPASVTLFRAAERALLALQGPEAEAVLARHTPEAAAMGFMSGRALTIGGIAAHVFRSGYTGEDGFEISLPEGDAPALWALLLADERVRPVGLGARDSLRLEAGLCLHGHDIDQDTSPVEAGLGWSIPKRRRVDGGFPGAERVRREFETGPARRRVGLTPDGRAPVREGAAITTPDGRPVGTVTSGGFGPSVDGPVAMGYVEAGSAAPGTELALVLRGRAVPARVVPLPFVPHRYRR